MLVNAKLEVSGYKRIIFKIVNSIGIVSFQWQSYNEVGNIGFLAFWRICEKLSCNVILNILIKIGNKQYAKCTPVILWQASSNLENFEQQARKMEFIQLNLK